MRPERILIQPLFRRPPLAPTVAAIVEQEHRQSQLVEELQILKAVNDITGVAMAPEYDRTIRLHLNVPTEQPRPIGSLKPYILKRQPTKTRPVSILPGLGMIDEELIKDTDSGLLVESQ